MPNRYKLHEPRPAIHFPFLPGVRVKYRQSRLAYIQSELIRNACAGRRGAILMASDKPHVYYVKWDNESKIMDMYGDEIEHE